MQKSTLTLVKSEFEFLSEGFSKNTLIFQHKELEYQILVAITKVYYFFVLQNGVYNCVGVSDDCFHINNHIANIEIDFLNKVKYDYVPITCIHCECKVIGKK